MKIIVYGDQLVIGGAQINAIELAATLQDTGAFEFIYFATPGPMVEFVTEKRLRYIPAPEGLTFPSPARMRALREAVRNERPDLIHVWEWGQCLDAFYAAYLPLRIPILVSHMMMDLTRLLPMTIPTTYGTPELRDQAIASGRRRTECLLPPVDIRHNASGTADGNLFRNQYDIKSEDIALVTVSRLHAELKSESLLQTIDAIRNLGRELPLKFIIVGDGDLREKLEKLACDVNTELRRHAVVLTGALLDPRPAYAAADIVIGMGGSALRGMAFGKPVIIVGEQGFSAPLTPETAELFYYKGIYGRGRSNKSNTNLVKDIRELAENTDLRLALGAFSRQFVVQHFSLESISMQLAEYYRDAASTAPPFHAAIADGLRTGVISLIEGKIIPYWALRKVYHKFGGPPIFPYLRNSFSKFMDWKNRVFNNKKL